MADAVAVDTWSAEGVRLGDVVSALGVLRDQSAERGSARTAVMTLVAVASGDEKAYAATSTLRALGGHHPARLVVVRPDPDSVASLDARATLYAIEADGHRLNFEEVVLSVNGQAALHLDSFVEAFTLSDLPVAVWYVNSLPDAIDPLLGVATAVILDSRDAGDDDVALRSLLELARRRTVVDLSWIRLSPWRELLAALFDPPDCRRWLEGIDGAEISGKSGPRRLLGGWLGAQLGLAPSQVRLHDDRHVAIRVWATLAGETASFSVERDESEHAVVAVAALPGGQTVTQRAALSDNPLPASLSTALTHLQPNLIWEKALSVATSLRT